jgi:hypothetical protein
MNPIASAKRRRRRARPPMTCGDLARDGRFDLSLCCPDCHGNPMHMLIHHYITSPNPLEGRHEAFICCFCIGLIDDWYPGKVITVFPEHEE